jgi:hypothetical protein
MIEGVELCAMPHNKKTVAEMIGELFREAAVLVGVFIPLDMIFTEKPMAHSVLAYGVGIFVLCLALGLGIEVMRRP